MLSPISTAAPSRPSSGRGEHRAPGHRRARTWTAPSSAERAALEALDRYGAVIVEPLDGA
jgi:hypothetical protein